jgi:hypothetical protein
MWPFDESAAQFPPQRSEEPENLRRDIVEELQDHLTCARRREQMRSGEQTEEAVQRRVLDRFGDPAAVARKLWLDWMWERIMNQRILVATCVLMGIISCVALGLAWASLNRQEDLIATWQATSETQLRDQQKLFERLLAESQKGKTPSDWNPVELRFMKGKENGPPADGINVNMSIEANETGIPPMSGVSNKEGIVRFERVRYGTYYFNVRNGANERFANTFTLQPGEGLTRTIVCPDPPTEPVQATPRIDWPDDLAKRAIWFRFQSENVHRPVAGNEWKAGSVMTYEGGSGPPGSVDPLIASNGDVAAAGRSVFGSMGGRLRGQGRFEWGQFPFDRLEYTVSRGRRSAAPSRGLQRLPEGLRWPGIEYRIPAVEVLISVEELASFEELTKLPAETDSGTIRSGGGFSATVRRSFGGLAIESADWSYRIEPSMANKPNTLWITPTVEAVEKVRTAIAEIDKVREAEKTALAELERARAEREQRQQSTAAPDGERKEGADDK